MAKKIEPVILDRPKWIKAALYCEISGHTFQTLQKNRARGIWTHGVHYKCGPEGSKTYYYNMGAIDKLISSHRLA